MIRSHIVKNKYKYEEVTILDHAFQKNVVCAAVSTAVTMTVNVFEQLGIQDAVVFTLTRGDFALRVKVYSKLGNLLIDNLVFILTELQRDYPEEIQIKWEETYGQGS